RRVQIRTDPRYTLSASGLPLALRQTVVAIRFSQIQGPDAPTPYEKSGLVLNLAAYGARLSVLSWPRTDLSLPSMSNSSRTHPSVRLDLAFGRLRSLALSA